MSILLNIAKTTNNVFVAPLQEVYKTNFELYAASPTKGQFPQFLANVIFSVLKDNVVKSYKKALENPYTPQYLELLNPSIKNIILSDFSESLINSENLFSNEFYNLVQFRNLIAMLTAENVYYTKKINAAKSADMQKSLLKDLDNKTLFNISYIAAIALKKLLPEECSSDPRGDLIKNRLESLELITQESPIIIKISPLASRFNLSPAIRILASYL